MRRAVAGISLLAIAAVPPSVVHAARGRHGGFSPAHVTVSDCHPSDDVADRYASFSGQMRAVPGAARMAMRFTLLERLAGGDAFRPVALPDLRPWRRSKPGVRAFIYTQRVTDLRDGGAYRMRVAFRWYDAQGAVIRRSVARSRTCRQPEPLPDLRIAAISSMPGPVDGERTYSITVANAGEGEAHDFDVALRIDGGSSASSAVDMLPAEESTVVQIEGPDCAFAVRAVADPTDVVRETDESDNALTEACTRSGS